jgi:hypothetical protein
MAASAEIIRARAAGAGSRRELRRALAVVEAELFRLRVAEARIDTAMRQLEDRRRLIEAAVLAASRGGSASAPGEGHV